MGDSQSRASQYTAANPTTAVAPAQAPRTHGRDQPDEPSITFTLCPSAQTVWQYVGPRTPWLASGKWLAHHPRSLGAGHLLGRLRDQLPVSTSSSIAQCWTNSLAKASWSCRVPAWITWAFAPSSVHLASAWFISPTQATGSSSSGCRLISPNQTPPWSSPHLTKPNISTSRQAATHQALAITLDREPPALRSTRNRPRTAVRQVASWTAAYHLQLTVAAVARPIRGSVGALGVLAAERS
jgi:hypothetical protein